MTGAAEAFEDKTILVTGGAGAIGGNLVRELVKRNTNEVIIIDDLSSSYEWNIPTGPNIRFIEGDILDDEKLSLAFKPKPDIVYHLAAHFANQNSVDHPERDLMVNGMGTLKVLQQARRSEVQRFVYASSGCGIYGSDSKMPYEEHDVSMKLSTPYQVTKMLGELYCNYFHSFHGLPTVNARFFNSYGPGEVPGRYRNVIPNFFFWALSEMALPITGTGKETRDFTYVGDVVQGLMSMGTQSEAVGEAFNIGTGKEVEIIHLAEEVNRLTGNNSGIRYAKRRSWDTKDRLLSSICKAENALGYSPSMPFDNGLMNTYRWFIENWEDIKGSAEF